MSTPGIVYVAYGEDARREAAYSAESVHKIHGDTLPVAVLCERPMKKCRAQSIVDKPYYDEEPARSRWSKLNADIASPYNPTLYLDADTRVYGELWPLFEMLADDWDMVISPSSCQGTDSMWHLGPEEKQATLNEIGYAVHLQGGMFAFTKNAATEQFFAAWRQEWYRWKDQDQGALMRALYRSPLRIWLMDRDWNGGTVVGHRYGAAKERS